MASRSKAAALKPLDRLERKVELLTRKLERAFPIVTFIGSFAPEAFEVVEPIPVTIRAVDGGFVASFLDANVNASGETQHGAFANLKDLMIANFDRLAKEPQNKLGKGPARRLAVLQSVMRRKEQHAANHKRARD